MAAMILPLLAALALGQAFPEVARETSRSGTGAPALTYRLGVASGGSCLGGGAAPTLIPFGASVTATSTQSAVLYWVQGGTNVTSINTTSFAITTVGATPDGQGAAFVLEPTVGLGSVTWRLENVFLDHVLPGSNTVLIRPGRAAGVCATGGVLSGVTTGRPCFLDTACTGGQTCVQGHAARQQVRGGYLCARSREGATSIKLTFDW